jgi:uncharacterized protein YecA (UPF0149 family)
MIKNTDIQEKTADVCSVCGKLAKGKIKDAFYCREHFNALVITKPIIKTGAIQNRNETCACGSGKKFKNCCAVKASNHPARHYFNSDYIKNEQPTI